MPDVLKRITTEYNAREDRIRLSGEADDSRVVVMWVTQRLFNRLLPPLLKHLEGQTRANPQPELLQTFVQESARAALKPQPAVKAEPGATTWLASTIDVAGSKKLVRLTFRGADGQAATLALSAEQVRQWLDVMHKTWVKAGWPLDMWPAWIKQPDQAAGQQSTHH